MVRNCPAGVEVILRPYKESDNSDKFIPIANFDQICKEFTDLGGDLDSTKETAIQYKVKKK